jgi:hypothetical protein
LCASASASGSWKTGVKERLLKRSPTKDQCEQLAQVWSHGVYGRPVVVMIGWVSIAQAQTDEPNGDLDSNWDYEDAAWSDSDEEDEDEDQDEDQDESESDIDSPTEISGGVMQHRDRMEEMSGTIVSG